MFDRIIAKYPAKDGSIDYLELIRFINEIYQPIDIAAQLHSYYEKSRYIHIMSVVLMNDFLTYKLNTIPHADEILEFAAKVGTWMMPADCSDLDFTYKMMEIWGDYSKFPLTCTGCRKHKIMICAFDNENSLRKMWFDAAMQVRKLTAQCEAQRAYIEQLECSPDPGPKYLEALADFESRANA